MPATRVLVVGGRDRLRFLHAVLAQDVGGLAPGDGAYGALTDDRGRPIADYQVFALPEAVLLELPRGRAGEARAALDRLVIADDVTTAWAEGETVACEAGDPAALAAVLAAAGLGRFAPPETGYSALAPGVDFAPGEPLSADDEASLAALPARRRAVLRGSRLGGHGALSWAPPAAAAGIPGTTPLGEDEREALEIEAGRIGAAELDEARVWNELGLLQAVSLTKGCWMGQEIVRRVHSRGEIRRRLGGVVLEATHGVGFAGARLETPDARPAGVITRAARASDRARTVALAFVAREAWAPGTPLVAVRADGGRVAAVTSVLPFVRRVPAGAGVPAFEPQETP